MLKTLDFFALASVFHKKIKIADNVEVLSALLRKNNIIALLSTKLLNLLNWAHRILGIAGLCRILCYAEA
mgnify:FL=1